MSGVDDRVGSVDDRVVAVDKIAHWQDRRPKRLRASTIVVASLDPAERQIETDVTYSIISFFCP